MAQAPPPSLRAALLVVHSPAAKSEPLTHLAERILPVARREIKEATGVEWEFVLPAPRQLDEARTASVADFLSKAITAMSEGVLDLVVVLTDVPISGQDRTLVYGSWSRPARMAVMSTHRLLQSGTGDEARTLGDAKVVANAAALFLHLVGHVIGLVHQWRRGDLMAPFRYDPERPAAPRFTDPERARLKRKARKLPDEKVEAAGPLMSFVFHLVSALRNLGEVLLPVAKGRAFRIPLAMPSMLTAALVPTLVLVFTGEAWLVGLGISTRAVVAFALVTVVAGSLYLAVVQNLFFPRKEKETLTEHAAVVNTIVWLCMLEALLGLFVLMAAFVWGLQHYLVPDTLLRQGTGSDTGIVVSGGDRVRLALFISTLGTFTATLGGGLDRQAVARHLALFSDRA